VVAAIGYIKRDDGEAQVITDIKAQNADLKKEVAKMVEENKVSLDANVTLLADLNKRVEEIEKRPEPEDQNINLHLKEPVTFNVVYHEKSKPQEPKPVLPEIPPQLSGKKSSKTPMLDRANIKHLPKENN
jgi:regulator of replication initiation timing